MMFLACFAARITVFLLVLGQIWQKLLNTFVGRCLHIFYYSSIGTFFGDV